MSKNDQAVLTAIEDFKITISDLEKRIDDLNAINAEISSLCVDAEIDICRMRISNLENCLTDLVEDMDSGGIITKRELWKSLLNAKIIDK